MLPTLIHRRNPTNWLTEIWHCATVAWYPAVTGSICLIRCDRERQPGRGAITWVVAARRRDRQGRCVYGKPTQRLYNLPTCSDMTRTAVKGTARRHRCVHSVRHVHFLNRRSDCHTFQVPASGRRTFYLCSFAVLSLCQKERSRFCSSGVLSTRNKENSPAVPLFSPL